MVLFLVESRVWGSQVCGFLRSSELYDLLQEKTNMFYDGSSIYSVRVERIKVKGQGQGRKKW